MAEFQLGLVREVVVVAAVVVVVVVFHNGLATQAQDQFVERLGLGSFTTIQSESWLKNNS